ncbi:ATP-grasp domain-containing protein [Fimbriiglobus ruber]|uniref:ATP-grasp domain-containing protein n=1 Tax=Fimbriiglobus ruber TaxID=1908690 RepID=A0A225DKP9_9BACT|nr:ATP-grasp domain-containing protein [Fimbriiglobus ruber]OWK39158.1 hypothetical protein FRUB_06240 [Fimbriiglobus ruber]
MESWTDTGEVRAGVRGGSPVFAKPLTETKSFVGCVVESEADLRLLQHLDDNLGVLAAEPVAFVSEWRYFVRRGRVVGLAHYKGEWSLAPDHDTVRRAVAAYVGAPAAYSLDYGVTADGRSLLVEANDAFALGPYGLDAVVYAEMLEDRWLELVGLPLA